MTRASDRSHASLADVQHLPFWTDQPGAPEAASPLTGNTSADLVVVGGGFTGLWTAIRAVERFPGTDVVLLESQDIAFGGTGRNGGFLSASLTHGHAHGEAIWPGQMKQLVQLGRANLQDIVDFVEQEGIEADVRLCGKTAFAVTAHQRASLAAGCTVQERWGEECEVFDADQARDLVHSPTYLGALRIRTGSGLMDPARLAWGLRAAAVRRGVRIHEHTPVSGLARGRAGITVSTPHGEVAAGRVALATNGFTPLLRRLRYRMVPIFDHVLVTEPLTPGQLDSIGWRENEGLTDMGNQFHYYRRTPDDRILWGGYDAIYHRGNGTDSSLEARDASHDLLARQFFQTFPQLEGLCFTHKWAGIIDSTSRFTPAFGTAFAGKVAYAVGFTGLGTASSRFGADVMLDLLHGLDTERTRLTLVRRKPFPFPPEPLRYPLIQFTRAQLAREDRTGERGAWLGMLDRLGIGFNS